MLIKVKAKKSKEGFVIPIIEDLKDLEEIEVEIRIHPKSLAGIFKNYAKPELIDSEKEQGWEKFVLDKYASR